MSLKAVAVNGFSYQISDLTVVATVTLTGTPSTKAKCGGQGVCKHGFGATITNVTVPSAGATIPDPGPYNVTFSALATKVKADSTLVLRLDDVTGNVTATPQVPGGPPVPHPVTFHLKITAAGQTKAKAQ